MSSKLLWMLWMLLVLQLGGGGGLVRAPAQAGEQQGSEGDPRLARPMQTISVVCGASTPCAIG